MSKQAYLVLKLNHTTEIVILQLLVTNIHCRAQQPQQQYVTIETNRCAPQMICYQSRHPFNLCLGSLKNYSSKSYSIQSRPSIYLTQMLVTQHLRSICHIARPVCLSIYLKSVSGLSHLLLSEERCILTYILQSLICWDMRWNQNCVTKWPTLIPRRIGAFPNLLPATKRP